MNKYLRNNRTITGRLDDELVMMDIEKGQYFALNPVASSIWEFLNSPRSIDDLCFLLQGEYEVDYALCREETVACLDEMIRLGIVLEDYE